MELIELCLPEAAGEEIRPRARAWCEAIGKTVVEVPNEPGFVVNRLLFPYLFDAVRLMEQTGMEAEDVDRCMTLGANYPMGPLALLDLIGVDVAVAIGEALYADSGEEHHRPPGRLIALVDAGQARAQVGRRLLRVRLAASVEVDDELGDGLADLVRGPPGRACRACPRTVSAYG